ncbi:MAG: hypothetical protein J7L07_08395 [Candidatus Odinarchaeota archaeon]|nr:hypothetical protein [Candidatus Odinarchaeota archaeon]
MDVIIQVLIGLIICQFLWKRIDRRKLWWFTFGLLLPDLDLLFSHQYVLHNIFAFTIITVITRRLWLISGLALHFFLDWLTTDFQTLFFPFAYVKLGLNYSWPCSTSVNLVIIGIFLLSLIYRGYPWKRNSKADLLRFTMIIFGLFIPLTIDIFKILKSEILTTLCTFLGILLLLSGFFINDEYIRNFFRFQVFYLGGTDGAGKTTHSRLLAKWFNEQGIPATPLHLFRNPILTLLSKTIHRGTFVKGFDYSLAHRRRIKRSVFSRLRPYILLLDNLLYILIKVWAERIKGKRVVIADRHFFDYILRHKLLDYPTNGLEWIYKRLMPKHGAILDVPIEVVLKRRVQHPVWYHKKAKEEFKKLAKEKNYIIIDTSKSIEYVHKKLRHYVLKCLGLAK